VVIQFFVADKIMTITSNDGEPPEDSDTQESGTLDPLASNHGKPSNASKFQGSKIEAPLKNEVEYLAAFHTQTMLRSPAASGRRIAFRLKYTFWPLGVFLIMSGILTFVDVLIYGWIIMDRVSVTIVTAIAFAVLLPMVPWLTLSLDLATRPKRPKRIDPKRGSQKLHLM
jgi:hypothetical protein